MDSKNKVYFRIEAQIVQEGLLFSKVLLKVHMETFYNNDCASFLSFSRVSDLLQGGAVMNKCYQSHEAHVPYLLQLFIDYNLYGMNLINLAAVKFRRARRKGDISEHVTLYIYCFMLFLTSS